MGFGLRKKQTALRISTNTLKAVLHKDIQLHFLVSRVWEYLLRVSWMMGAGTRLLYSKPCSSFPSLLQVGAEHRCSFSIITFPYCLANQRDANLFSPWWVSLPEDWFPTFSTARSTETKRVDTGFTAWGTSGGSSATRTSSPGWPGNRTWLLKSYRTAEFLLPHWGEGIASVKFSQSVFLLPQGGLKCCRFSKEKWQKENTFKHWPKMCLCGVLHQ